MTILENLHSSMTATTYCVLGENSPDIRWTSMQDLTWPIVNDYYYC